MIHTLAFQANTGAAADNVLLAGVADPVFSRSTAGNFQIPKPHYIIALYGGSATFTGARINVGSLRQKGFPQIVPYNGALLPPNDPNLYDCRMSPIPLRGNEDFRIDSSDSGAGEVQHVSAWICDTLPSYQSPPPDSRWLRFTATVTAVANAYSNVATITLDDTLESGTYIVWGAQVQGAQIIVARFVPQNSLYRPGVLGQAALVSRSHQIFRGQLGPLFTFTDYTPPQIETLESGSGASSIVGYLLCSKQAG